MKIISILALVVIAYLLGAWKSHETSDSISTSEESTSILKENAALDKLNDEERSTIALFEEASPSVVFITTTTLRRDFWSMRAMEIPQGTGSGFFWDEYGHIVTNFHVLQNANRIKVRLDDQTEFDAEYIGGEPSKDLAVIKIRDIDPDKIKPLNQGQSAPLKVGQSAYAIGNPFGLDHTLTTGIISALGREIESVSGVPIKDVIQTDAAINPGNSGGPLLNSSGELIGVNTAIYSPSGAYAGVGFSIPVDVLEWVIPDLIKYGKVQRPSLGFEPASAWIKNRLRIKKGVLVWNIEPRGPAALSGIKGTSRDQRGNIVLGDIILAINDTPVNSNHDLILALEQYRHASKVSAQILRDQKIRAIDIALK